MPGKQLEHVIKERQPGTDARLTTAIEVQLYPHVGLFSLALDLRDPRRVLRQMVFGFFHKSSPRWNGVSTGSGSDRVQVQSVDPEINPVATAPGTDLIQSGVALRLPLHSKYFSQCFNQEIVFLGSAHAQTETITQHRVTADVTNQNALVN